MFIYISGLFRFPLFFFSLFTDTDRQAPLHCIVSPVFTFPLKFSQTNTHSFQLFFPFISFRLHFLSSFSPLPFIQPSDLCDLKFHSHPLFHFLSSSFPFVFIPFRSSPSLPFIQPSDKCDPQFHSRLLFVNISLVVFLPILNIHCTGCIYSCPPFPLFPLLPVVSINVTGDSLLIHFLSYHLQTLPAKYMQTIPHYYFSFSSPPFLLPLSVGFRWKF